MLKKTVTIQNPSGMHARPASLFVQKATSYPCEIHIIKGTKTVNGKSIMGLMSLAIAKGDQITLETNGDREKEALEELGGILESIHE